MKEDINTHTHTHTHTHTQLSAIRKVLKLPTSASIVSIYLETGELPIILACEKRQLTYLCILLNSRNQQSINLIHAA